AKFIDLLEKLFPHKKGIPLSVPLKEDFEMNGFYILKDYIFVNNGQVMIPSQDEPFEEFDMRIYDIFEDARKIAEFQSSSSSSSNTPNGLNKTTVNNNGIDNGNGNNVNINSRNDADSSGSDDDEDDDEIVLFM